MLKATFKMLGYMVFVILLLCVMFIFMAVAYGMHLNAHEFMEAQERAAQPPVVNVIARPT